MIWRGFGEVLRRRRSCFSVLVYFLLLLKSLNWLLCVVFTPYSCWWDLIAVNADDIAAGFEDCSCKLGTETAGCAGDYVNVYAMLGYDRIELMD